MKKKTLVYGKEAHVNKLTSSRSVLFENIRLQFLNVIPIMIYSRFLFYLLYRFDLICKKIDNFIVH
ncbi:hypothetical protein CsatB_013647 [Cannabis sativa]